MEFNHIALLLSRALYICLFTALLVQAENCACNSTCSCSDIADVTDFLAELHMCESAGLETALFSQRDF